MKTYIVRETLKLEKRIEANSTKEAIEAWSTIDSDIRKSVITAKIVKEKVLV